MLAKEAITDEQFMALCGVGNTQEAVEAVKVGANVNAKDNNGFTALMWAAYNGRAEQ